MSVLDLVDTQHLQAKAVARREVNIEFLPMGEVTNACNSIFALVDRDDEYQREVPRLAWRLKTTLLQTLLPFDDDRLSLRQMTGRLATLVEALPGMAGPARTICSVVDALLSHPRNPKRDRLSAMLADVERAPVNAILAGLQGASSPGWPLDLDVSRDLGLSGTVLLRSRRDLHGRAFGKLVILGSLRFAVRPFVNDALYGGRAGEIVIAAYRGERVHVPVPMELPRDGTFKTTRHSQQRSSNIEEEAADGQLDKWVNDSFWEGLRAQHPDVAPVSDRDVLVDARYVLFADSSGAFLPEDRTVIEISDLLDRGDGFAVGDDRMPRKAVDDLEERDLVLLRLSGSGDYLEEVADALMAKEGLPNLRSDATEWKSLLYSAMKRHGEGIVARAARDRGVKLRSAGYLWVWAGDAVIAPQSYETFRLLVAALSGLDGLQKPEDPDGYSMQKWQQMEQVKDFHRRAGSEIRAALLERVGKLIAERQTIETVASIDLPRVHSGQMGLLRVSAVDVRSVRVPHSKLFRIHPVKVA